MRTTVSFEVAGDDLPALRAEVLRVYQELLADNEAELPYSAVLDVREAQRVETGRGEVVSRRWEGHFEGTVQGGQ